MLLIEREVTEKRCRDEEKDLLVGMKKWGLMQVIGGLRVDAAILSEEGREEFNVICNELKLMCSSGHLASIRDFDIKVAAAGECRLRMTCKVHCHRKRNRVEGRTVSSIPVSGELTVSSIPVSGEADEGEDTNPSTFSRESLNGRLS
jgi:hypothetical protein